MTLLFQRTPPPYLHPYSSPAEPEWDECFLTGATRPPVIDPHLEFSARTEESYRRYREVIAWIEGAADLALARYGIGHPRYQATIDWCFAMENLAAAQYKSPDWELACLCEALREEEQRSWDPAVWLRSANGHGARVSLDEMPLPF